MTNNIPLVNCKNCKFSSTTNNKTWPIRCEVPGLNGHNIRYDAEILKSKDYCINFIEKINV